MAVDVYTVARLEKRDALVRLAVRELHEARVAFVEARELTKIMAFFGMDSGEVMKDAVDQLQQARANVFRAGWDLGITNVQVLDEMEEL